MILLRKFPDGFGFPRQDGMVAAHWRSQMVNREGRDTKHSFASTTPAGLPWRPAGVNFLL